MYSSDHQRFLSFTYMKIPSPIHVWNSQTKRWNEAVLISETNNIGQSFAFCQIPKRFRRKLMGKNHNERTNLFDFLTSYSRLFGCPSIGLAALSLFTIACRYSVSTVSKRIHALDHINDIVLKRIWAELINRQSDFVGDSTASKKKVLKLVFLTVSNILAHIKTYHHIFHIRIGFWFSSFILWNGKHFPLRTLFIFDRTIYYLFWNN